MKDKVKEKEINNLILEFIGMASINYNLVHKLKKLNRFKIIKVKGKIKGEIL